MITLEKDAVSFDQKCSAGKEKCLGKKMYSLWNLGFNRSRNKGVPRTKHVRLPTESSHNIQSYTSSPKETYMYSLGNPDQKHKSLVNPDLK
jgi:hypothetical protein